MGIVHALLFFCFPWQCLRMGDPSKQLVFWFPSKHDEINQISGCSSRTCGNIDMSMSQNLAARPQVLVLVSTNQGSILGSPIFDPRPHGCGSKPMGSHFWIGAPPFFRTYFSGWIGKFTGGTIWVLTHGHVFYMSRLTKYGQESIMVDTLLSTWIQCHFPFLWGFP